MTRAGPWGGCFSALPCCPTGAGHRRSGRSEFTRCLGQPGPHRGVDFPAPEGTPVVAAAAGTIEFAGSGNELGNFVVVAHGKGVATRYGHLSRIAGGVVAGARVRAGTVLGSVGKTGLATAPHLHFEFRIWGEPIDMGLLDVDPEAPIRPPFREGFDAERVRLRALLDGRP